MLEDSSNQTHFGIKARWIYTANDHQELLHNHTVFIKNGSIDKIAPSELNNQSNIIDLGESILTPGLINMHTHSAMTFLKGIADDQKLTDWLEQSIWPNEAKFLNHDLVFEASQLACLEMISSGVTTFNDMYFYPEATAKAAIKIGLRANIGLVFIDLKTNYASDFTDYFDKGFAFRDNFRDESLITTSLAPHAPYTVSDESFKKIRTYADQLGLNIHCHLHETEWEINESLKKFHCVHLNQSDFQLIESNQINIISCPSSNLKLASGIPPINLMIDKAKFVTIGTDGSASNNKLSVLDDLRLFSLLQRNDRNEHEFLKSEDLMDMVTIDAAKTLDLDSIIGSIEVGKKADLAAFDLSNIFTQPVYDPLSSLIYSGSRDNVQHVWVDGQLKFKNKQLVNVDDAESVIEKVKLWQNKIQ
jgi:5-methylthioadenosine/S-adenosylhomocysteine deaminase